MQRCLRLVIAAIVSLTTGLALASPLVVTDLGSPFTQTGISQQGSQIALGSGLTAVTLGAGVSALSTSFASGTLGVLGANAAGGITFANTGNIFVGPAVQTASTKSFGLAASSDIAFSAGLWVGIGSSGGLVALDPVLNLAISGSSTGLLDTRSELVNLSLGQGQQLFGGSTSIGTAADGLVGVTTDGRLRFVQTTNGAFGAASVLSRELGFVADGGLAFVNGFIVGVNAGGSLNAYDPFLDLLLAGIGPAGLFSTSGGLEAFDVSGGGLDARFVGDDVSGTRGVLGVSSDGGLAYVRLDSIAAPGSATDSARTASLGLDLASALALNSRTLVTAFGTDVQEVPEPATPALALAAGLAALALRRRAH